MYLKYVQTVLYLYSHLLEWNLDSIKNEHPMLRNILLTGSSRGLGTVELVGVLRS